MLCRPGSNRCISRFRHRSGGADAGFDAEASDQRARLRAESEDASTIEKFNRLLYTSERLLTREEGLPGRPWYRH